MKKLYSVDLTRPYHWTNCLFWVAQTGMSHHIATGVLHAPQYSNNLDMKQLRYILWDVKARRIETWDVYAHCLGGQLSQLVEVGEDTSGV